MKWKLLDDKPDRRAFVLVFDTHDDLLSELLRFANEQKVATAHFAAIGACERVTLGYFDLKKKDYDKIPIDEQVEVMSVSGNIASYEGEPKIHAHIVIGKRDGSAHGGHLLEAVVRPTLEMFLNEVPVMIRRSMDADTNLPLIDLDA
jgi:uncharacterized protein